MFTPTKNIRSMKRVSPPKRGAAEPVNLKTHRNPAKTARGPFGLVHRRAHFFARISCVFKECVSNGLGIWFSFFCRNKRTIKTPCSFLTKMLPKAFESKIYHLALFTSALALLNFQIPKSQIINPFIS